MILDGLPDLYGLKCLILYKLVGSVTAGQDSTLLGICVLKTKVFVLQNQF
jgi:hypothetical protein